MGDESKLDLLVRTMPDAMAELVKAFTDKKELNARVEIRMRIKAVLDFLSADTVHPPNPLLAKSSKGPVQDAVLNIGGGGDSTGTGANVTFGQSNYVGSPGMFSPIATPVPIGEARPIMDNSEVLG